MNNINELSIPLTIEKQLENYSQKEGHTERHETMWHAWYQNKKWLGQLLQITIHSFPTHSRHDETHALSVLNNIEMILGQERIAELSATDCFVLLHTVYIHDIGMCITQQDRKDIIENENFIYMIERLEKEGDDTTKNAIKILKTKEHHVDNDSDYMEQMKQLYRAKLDVYYAIIQLMADYRRGEHGKKSSEKLYEWTLSPEKLGIGFSMAGVPLRVFLAIARCAQLHTSDDFNDILKLPKKDGGYASDYYHPRFITILLMLGDLLDMDNNRFHPMVFDLVEDFPGESRNHYDKHRAIRKLLISPTAIEIEADCENQNALRLVRKECEMLADILQNAGYRWSAICPNQFRGSLPTLGEVNLYLNDKKIPEELVTAQFIISQEKAFAILEGSNLYEGRFVFIREFLQNAIDASKMQYFYEYLGKASYYYGEGMENKSPAQMNQELSLDNFPIEITMKMQKKSRKGQISDISIEEIEQIKGGKLKEYSFGVTVFIKDFGTGIDKESIVSIAKVGNSRLRDQRIIQKMPKWLRPTAEFGVGLQSAFMVTDFFKCTTYTRSKEKYEITFHSGSSSRYEGYINVIPLEKDSAEYESFGTCFQVFVPLDKKLLHSESVCTWSGADPFDRDYEKNKIFRHASELISQMALYIDSMLGEILFPVLFKIDTQSVLKPILNKTDSNRIQKMIFMNDETKWKDVYKERKSWIYKKENHKDENKFLFGEFDDVIYAYEYNSSRIFLWNQSIQAFCVVSGLNLLKKEQEGKKNTSLSKTKAGITVYYKGIELQHSCVKEEIEIFEYIDIKGELNRSYINISRRGFTKAGNSYFEESIYKKLLDSVKYTLKHINNSPDRKGIKEAVLSNIDEKLNIIFEEHEIEIEASESKEAKSKIAEFIEVECNESYNMLVKTAQQLVAISILAYLALKDTKDQMSQFGKSCIDNNTCIWQELIKQVKDKLERLEKEKRSQKLMNKLRNYTVLFNIEAFAVYKKNDIMTFFKTSISILDIFDSCLHFGLLQKRENEHANWKTNIILVEEDIYTKCEELVLNDSECIKKMDERDKEDNKESIDIESWFSEFLDSNQAVEDAQFGKRRDKQQFFMNWLAQSIPVLAVASSQNGNIRFNILSNYIYPCIYTNEEQRLQTVNRILQTADKEGIQRFSTYAWQGKQYLVVEQTSFSCYFIKTGYMNRVFLQSVIFPLNGVELKEIAKRLYNTDKLEFVQNIKMLADRLDFKAYFAGMVSDYLNKKRITAQENRIMDKLSSIASQVEQSKTSLIIEFTETLADLITTYYLQNSKNLLAEEEYFERVKLDKEKWEDFYIRIMDVFLDTKIPSEENPYSRFKEISNDKIFNDICQGYSFLKEKSWKKMNNTDYLSIPKMKKEYLDDYEKGGRFRNRCDMILDYIIQNVRTPIRKEYLEKCFEKYIDEIFSLYEILEKRNAQATIDTILQ